MQDSDAAIQHSLTQLRDGSPAEKVQARRLLASVFEQRGMYDEAIDLLVANVRAGARNAEVSHWLERLYNARSKARRTDQIREKAAFLAAHSISADAPDVTVNSENDVTVRRCRNCRHANDPERWGCERCKATLAGVPLSSLSGLPVRITSPQAQMPAAHRGMSGSAIGRRVFGLILFLLGVFVTVSTYWAASHGEGNGHYTIWYGAIIVGLSLLTGVRR
jgi:hypothetical protein